MKYKVKGCGIVWDKAAGKPLVHFKDGEAEVDEATGKKLKALGYTLEKIEEIEEPKA